MPILVCLSCENIVLARAPTRQPWSKGSIFHQCRWSFCQSLNGRNDYPNHNTLQSPPSKQAALIVRLLWCMACLNEAICHRGSEKSINNRAIIYSSKLIGEAYRGKQCVTVCNYKLESEVYLVCSLHWLLLWICSWCLTDNMFRSHTPGRYKHVQAKIRSSLYIFLNISILTCPPLLLFFLFMFVNTHIICQCLNQTKIW